MVNEVVVGPGSYCHFPPGVTMFHAPADDRPVVFLNLFHGPSDVEPVEM
jgi:quercetin dioxygenase-like cupin family protein